MPFNDSAETDLHLAFAQIPAHLVGIGVRVVDQLVVDGRHVIVDDGDAILHLAGRITVLGQLVALVDQLCLQRRLIGEHIVEVPLGDANDDLAGHARIVRLTAETAMRHLLHLESVFITSPSSPSFHYHSGALANVLTGLQRRLVSVHVVVDGVNVSVDNLLARIRRRLSFEHRQSVAFHQQLRLQGRLVIDGVVEVMTGNVDDDLASTARIRWRSRLLNNKVGMCERRERYCVTAREPTTAAAMTATHRKAFMVNKSPFGGLVQTEL